MPPYRKNRWIITSILAAPFMAGASVAYVNGGSWIKKFIIFVLVSLGIIAGVPLLMLILGSIIGGILNIPKPEFWGKILGYIMILWYLMIWPFSWWIINDNWYKLKYKNN